MPLARTGSVLALAVILAAAASAGSADEPLWEASQIVTVPLGQTAGVYAKRGKSCGDDAPGFAELAGRLPRTTLGTYSDGGIVLRSSDSCATARRATRLLKARLINLTAKAKGVERLNFFGDHVTITVR